MRRLWALPAIAMVAGLGSGVAYAADGGLDVAIGKAIFDRLWVTAPSSTRATDGLGPLFNQRSCAACHPAAGRGRTPDGANDPGVGFVLRMDDDPVYGRQIQTSAAPGLLAEGKVSVRYRDVTVSYPGGGGATLRRPEYGVTNLAYGPLTRPLHGRVAPPVRGIGLLERVPEAAILALADPDDRDGDGVSGRAVLRPADGAPAVARFGRKGSHATLSAQNADAFHLDIGMSTPFHREPWGDCTEAQAACRTAPHGDSPEFEGLEIPSNILALLDGFVRSVPPPPAPARPSPAGESLFTTTGCAACHRPGLPLEGGGTVAAFTDLLLHDLGPDLAEDGTTGEVAGAEWRTAPLWGLAAAGQPGRQSLLHDGRARSVEEAILWHGGEAGTARRRFMALPRADRARLLTYVGSL